MLIFSSVLCSSTCPAFGLGLPCWWHETIAASALLMPLLMPWHSHGGICYCSIDAGNALAAVSPARYDCWVRHKLNPEFICNVNKRLAHVKRRPAPTLSLHHMPTLTLWLIIVTWLLWSNIPAMRQCKFWPDAEGPPGRFQSARMQDDVAQMLFRIACFLQAVCSILVKSTTAFLACCCAVREC